jgi:hypothetical protein
MYVHVTLRRVRVTIVAEEKQYNSECASVALFIQHAKCTRRITLSSVACPAVPVFSTLSHKRHDFFKKNVIQRKTSILIFYKTFVHTIFYPKFNQARYDQNVYWSSCTIPAFLVGF